MAERPQRLVAHTPPEGSGEWHYLDDHLREVARLASEFAAPFGGGDLAWWAGIFHDLGKAHPDFQDYLWKNFIEPKKKHPTVDHKTAGAVRSREAGGDVLCQIIHGHHGGLTDDGEVASKIRAYTETQTDRLFLSLKQFGTLDLLNATTQSDHPVTPPLWFRGDKLELEMLVRMIFSSLVDADALNTEHHWNHAESAIRTARWPTIPELEQRFMANQVALETAVQASDRADTTVNRIRRRVYSACLEGATHPPGFFRMTVPTGGGKTRSGLAFALRHATLHGQRRIIVAVPFITITEQTADVYTQALGVDALIEHHSGLEPTSKVNDEDPDGADQRDAMRRRLASQNWDAHLIVTTNVQLFESLFANRTSKVRKLHNLADSVIILDEIQTLPAIFREPILDVLRELVVHYNVTVVLSTATQPVLDTIEERLSTIGGVTELAPDPADLFDALRRVDYQLPCLDESWSWERVADEMWSHPQAMTVVNTVKDARVLFQTLGDENAMHLSSGMCGAHRRYVLAKVRRRLRDKDPCRLVSTQLVEAGVDLDFPLVLRASGPLDSIVQAAGRCNREGLMEENGQVIVFRSDEDSMPRGEYRIGAEQGQIMLARDPEGLHQPDVFLEYFASYFALIGSDRYEIQKARAQLNFAIVGERMQIIKDDTIPVLVNYPALTDDEDQRTAWKDVRDRLRAYQPERGQSLRTLMRDAQPWLVQVRRNEREKLTSDHSITPIIDDVVWEWNDRYDDRLGILDSALDPTSLYAG